MEMKEIAVEQGALAAIEEVNASFLALATLMGIQGTPEEAKSFLDFFPQYHWSVEAQARNRTGKAKEGV